ncbi:imm11 family protein [Roseibium sediminis]|uniref:imm11 family protein n=1 Tax=Roseibium sediminis TaxID=1775174 RepID=UPI001AD8B4E4|nr:DUF1629 domain-containing protein [Roseibium sediminis]
MAFAAGSFSVPPKHAFFMKGLFEVTQDVWISSVGSNSQLFDKPGIREKYFDQDWAPAKFEFDTPTNEHMQNLQRYKRADKLQRRQLLEAAYVFDEKRWSKVKDLFALEGFYAVKGKLAEILKQFDLGGTDLVEFPIYQADKTTQLPGPFYFLNLGSQKDCLLPELSTNLEAGVLNVRTGKRRWRPKTVLHDGDAAVTIAALEGADLWVDPKFPGKIFMSGPLHDAIEAAGLKIDFLFAKARIVEE